MITRTQLKKSELYYEYELLIDSGADSGAAEKHVIIT